ncbi:MAG TPA: CRISPR-associated helicase Cas3' [Rhodanobacteraceae bacterium]|nr:CRISPR-associated helicase Cas3' [Rhodanobacteraceae bacterium]
MTHRPASFNNFFQHATGQPQPYAFQARLAEEPWPDLLDVPTGMGKTAAVTLAWLWKRGWRDAKREVAPDADTPRRLVWCLPMRVLVEQTADNIRGWLDQLRIDGSAGEGKVSVHVLMGGENDLNTWAEYPEEDMILIGTQDMLLSRALMRGYGMSRYQWPIHFALLHNDCLWAFDEVQLMGAGIATSAQLEAFRRSHFPLAKGSRSLWLSATLNPDWLATVDMQPHVDSLACLGINERDREQAGNRLRAIKTLAKADITLDKSTSNKAGMNAYLDALCAQVLQHHDKSAQTLVILNRVDRAQQLFRELQKHRDGSSDLLIHARFRAAERAEQARRLQDKAASSDRIIVATQAIEAGVDISSKTLITELAPWASLVQRFGRCNRYGEYNDSGAKVLWIDIEDDADSKPYETDVLATTRDKISALESASAADLPKTDQPRPLTAVLRRKDLLDLFNTDPDLSGFDVDVSDYIRDSGTPGLQVFWREFKDDPNQSGVDARPVGKPVRDEICPVSMGQAKDIEKRAWYWDALGDDRHNGQWTRLHRRPRPGMTLLLSTADGGYDKTIGFDLGLKKLPVEVIPHDASADQDSYGDDWRSRQNRSVPLPAHLGHVAKQAQTLCSHVGQNAHRDSVIRAGRWHDLGKLHEVFQKSMYRCHKDAEGNPQTDPSRPLAKSNCQGPMRHERPFFRHELASMLGWLAQHDGEPDADLVAYLILAHHGKVRMSLRAMPTEKGGEGTKRFARGVHEGDTLPALDFDGEHSNETILKLALMEMGKGEQGPSWAERALKLLNEHGPFQLAWLETLVRLADWRASAAEQLANTGKETNNASHELDHSHPSVATPEPGATAADSPPPSAAQGSAQHGFRGRAGEPEDAGSRTRPPHAATRHLDTALGILSYSELAPHLSRYVEALQDAIAEGEFDQHDLDESLLLCFHQRICGDLTPAFSGHWRTTDVIVGSHEPPPHHKVGQAMRTYVQDLAARIDHLPPELDELWLEALAFAEGRLLSIHPFADFNGRVTRVFMDWLTRRLNLPDIDPTPDEGEPTERYLAALRAGDQFDWQPLMAIWRERFEKGLDA